MAIAFSLLGEVKIIAPAGTMTIAISQAGCVIVTPSWDRSHVKLSLDTLKAAKERVKTGKCPKGFAMMSDPAPQPRGWWRKMLEAAEDAVKRYQNDQAELAPPGTPFGRRKAYRLIGG